MPMRRSDFERSAFTHPTISQSRHHVRWLVAAVVLFLCCGPAISIAKAETTDRIVLLSGKEHTGKLMAINDGKVTFQFDGEDKQSKTFDLQSIRQIIRSEIKPRQAMGEATAYLMNGSKFRVDKARTDGESFTCTYMGQEMKLPVSAVAGFVMVDLGSANPDQQFLNSLSDTEEEQDRLFVEKDGQLLAIEGLIKSLSRDEMSFDFAGETRQIKRNRIYAATFGHPGRKISDSTFAIRLADNAIMQGSDIALSGDHLSVTLVENIKVKLPSDAVTSITVKSDRVVYLSKLEPTAYEQDSGLDRPRPWQRNRSVMGKPLTLDGRVYETGIGMKSRSKLTYTLKDDYEFFSATVGIDDSTYGKGHCVFIVMGDGKEIKKLEMSGTDDPVTLVVPVEGVSELSLIVDFGKELSISDHADWADARLLKPE